MAKALIVCFRKKSGQDFRPFLEKLSARLTPDNLIATDAYIYADDTVLTYIHNPSPTVRIQQASLCLGLTSAADVFRPGSSKPDDTFALFRVDPKRVEIVSDYTASRTIWFHCTPEFFIASTSQRMIVTFLRGFCPNLTAARWMLSSGSLGPHQSWDERLQPLLANTSLMLDRVRWGLRLENGPPLTFTPEHRTAQSHRRLAEAVEKSVHDLKIEPERWTLALSGGMDSRSLLYHLRGAKGLRTVTWGLRGALGKQDSDAAIARRLADQCQLPHEFVLTDADSVSFATILRRFFIAGEGRIDHLHGYMDGLNMWASLSASGRGILRGYDAFGRKPPVRNAYQARRASSLLVTTDYRLPSLLPRELTLSEQDIPLPLRTVSGESLSDWRDRLWLQFRTPYVTAALDDIKTAYVEIVNPLLCREVVETVQRLPIALRENKIIFDNIVRQMFRDVPFAARYAIQQTDEILSLPSITFALRDSLLSARPTSALTGETISLLIMQMKTGVRRASLRRRLTVACKAHAPRFVENYFRTRLRHEPLDFRRLALRALIVLRMNELLTEDAQAGRDAFPVFNTGGAVPAVSRSDGGAAWA